MNMELIHNAKLHSNTFVNGNSIFYMQDYSPIISLLNKSTDLDIYLQGVYAAAFIFLTLQWCALSFICTL